MASARILVIDDNPTNLKLASYVLENDGSIVEEAESAEAALERIRDCSPELLPHLVLVDIELPGMDGLAFTRIIKADPATKHIPIVALTAYAMKGDEERARKAGCDGYLSKPINTRTLSAQLAQYLRNRICSVKSASKILVVEDVPVDLKLARIILTLAGYEVIEAESGEKALTLLHDDRPSLVLLDLKLPGINGLALLRQVRRDAAICDIPVVAVTSYPHDWSCQEARDAGCTAYFSKPVDAGKLLHEIAGIISLNPKQ